MTTPEHTLVGILGGLSLGLHTRFGWPAIAFAAFVSNIPDLDGLPMLVDMQRFEAGHRVWGHNFLAIFLTSIVIALLQFRFRWIERAGRRTARFLPSESQLPDMSATPPIHLLALVLMGVFFQSVHLLCDITVSGGKGLSNWSVKPFWPFSDASYVYPLIPWGDVGPTVIMMLGVILVAKVANTARTRRIAIASLAVLCVYMVYRGCARGITLSFGV